MLEGVVYVGAISSELAIASADFMCACGCIQNVRALLREFVENRLRNTEVFRKDGFRCLRDPVIKIDCNPSGMIRRPGLGA